MNNNRTEFQIFLGRDSQFYFRYMAANGEQLLRSEGYTTKQNCSNGINSVKRLSTFESSYQRFTDSKGEYRYNILAETKEPVATSSEGYSSFQGRENAINIVKAYASTAEVKDLTLQAA